MLRDERAKRGCSILTENDFGVEIGVIELPHELAAGAAGRQNMKLACLVATPDGDHLAKPVLALSDRCGEGAPLRT